MYISILLEEYKKLIKLEARISVLRQMIDDGNFYVSASDKPRILRLIDDLEEKEEE